MIIDDDIKRSRAFFHEIERSYHLLPYYLPSKILQSPSFAYFIEPQRKSAISRKLRTSAIT